MELTIHSIKRPQEQKNINLQTLKEDKIKEKIKKELDKNKNKLKNKLKKLIK